VNVAARLQQLAEPGGICVSAKVRDEVGRKLAVNFEDLGTRELKNVDAPVHIYRVGGTPAAKVAAYKQSTDKPSIAVLPFANMSGDPAQEYFSDGIVEEIITALSRMRSLIVIARNSSFAYKGRAVDVKQVARELGVRYVLEGSVRKAANRLRISGQLIDAETGAHLWADRFDGDLEDIFDLQDQVTARVVGAIAPKLDEAEIERIRSKPTESLDAYDCFLRGMAGLHKWSREGNDAALAHFYRAIELDPNYAAAHGLAARTYLQRNAGGWVTDRAHELAEASRLARRAVELGHDDAVALATAASACPTRRYRRRRCLHRQALELNPNWPGPGCTVAGSRARWATRTWPSNASRAPGASVPMIPRISAPRPRWLSPTSSPGAMARRSPVRRWLLASGRIFCLCTACARPAPRSRGNRPRRGRQWIACDGWTRTCALPTPVW
jgi:adenylate cyclase